MAKRWLGRFEPMWLAAVRESAESPERTFPVPSAEDIVLLKLEWYKLGGQISDRQWNDILGVLKVQGPLIDFAYLRRWASSLAVSALLTRALDDSGLA